MARKIVGVSEAKTCLSALINAAQCGETVIIARRGKPVAQIGPIAQVKPSLTPTDAMRGLFSIEARLRGLNLRQIIDARRRF